MSEAFFVKLIKVNQIKESIAYCTVEDNNARRQAIILASGGVLSIPKIESKVLVIKPKDLETLIVLGTQKNSSLVEIDSNTRNISINCEDFNVIVNGVVSLGNEGGAFVLTEEDTFEIVATGQPIVDPNTGIPTSNIPVTVTTKTTKTKAS